jgi:hypothetical protein
MADIECIDPQVGSWFLGLDEASVQQEVGDWAWEPTVAIGARVHWHSCPSCQAEYPNAIETIESLRPAIEAMVRKTLLKKRTETLAAMTSCSIATNELRDCFAQKLAVLEASGEDVQWALSYISEDTSDFTVRTDSYDESSQRVPLSKYSGFITSLDIQLQTFVFESILCNEIFWSLRRKFYSMMFPRVPDPNPDVQGPRYFVENPDYVGEVGDFHTFIRTRLADAIASSGYATDALFAALQSAASDYQRRFTDTFGTALSRNTAASAGDLSGPVLPDRIALQELRSEMADSFDSLRAGQMELRRLIDINSRSAAAYEDEIELQLGSVYPLLNAKTQQLLQQAEYQYRLLQPGSDFFHGPVIMLANAYENELLIRVIWPYLTRLLGQGTQTYDGGSQKTFLILEGQIQSRNLILGSMSWHLQFDKSLRRWITESGFTFADVIWKDAQWLSRIRNTAAHESICSRAVADDVRHRIFRKDGILAHLHVTSGSSD